MATKNAKDEGPKGFHGPARKKICQVASCRREYYAQGGIAGTTKQCPLCEAIGIPTS